MSKYPLIKLGEVATIVSGSTPKTNVSEYWDGEYNWVTPAELNDDVHVIYETERKISEKAVVDTGLKLLPKGTVLLSSRAPIGKVAIAGTEMYCNQGFKNLICSDRIYNKYLFWFLKGKTDYLNSLGRGATFKEISKAIVEKMQIPLPPLENQKQIAKTLDTVSELLSLRKQQLVELNNLIRSVFYDMFGDPVTNEKGWDIGTIRDIVAEVKYGTSKPAQEKGKFIYLRMNNITYDGEMDYSDIKYIDLPDYEAEKYFVRKGDVLFNRTNSKELVGKTAVFKNETPMIIAGYIIRVRVNERADPEFLSAILNSKYGKETLRGMCKAIIGQANINAQELQNIRIFIPPISLQKQFANIVNKIGYETLTVE